MILFAICGQDWRYELAALLTLRVDATRAVQAIVDMSPEANDEFLQAFEFLLKRGGEGMYNYQYDPERTGTHPTIFVYIGKLLLSTPIQPDYTLKKEWESHCCWAEGFFAGGLRVELKKLEDLLALDQSRLEAYSDARPDEIVKRWRDLEGNIIEEGGLALNLPTEGSDVLSDYESDSNHRHRKEIGVSEHPGPSHGDVESSDEGWDD